ncbi:MAG: hypothetical protein ACREAL_00900 [Nitrosopumilaceae archaeon]
MNKIYLVIALVFAVGLGIGFSVNVSGEEALIPSWIKNTAGFWVNDQISDKEFISALQWLIDNGILTVSQKDPKLDALEQEMQKRMLENMLAEPEDAPMIGIGGPGGAFCINNLSGDPYDEGKAEFLLDVMNHDEVSHSPIIELQLTDDYDRPIITKTIELGKLEPKEVKTIDEFLDFTRLANNCNVIIKKVN